ncbi:MAG: acetyltransferase [Omnitrophica WOR_2 bacterium SM23_29]|nr:MAG: acetyltransferase [Omnitrophica WOR_2 bacterium SM23_29]
MIRKADLKDIRAVHKLINYYAKKNVMLPRTISDLCESIRDFWVFGDGKILGCAALHVYSDDLAEVKSLAVDSCRRRKGIGGKLLEVCLEEAKGLGIKKVFVLTLVPRFFKKFGFKAVDKAKLPQKIWNECVVCAKFSKCDELAYIKRL